MYLSSKSKSALAKIQEGYCPVCETSLFNNEELEVHHILPQNKGGNHSLKNLKLLHKVCHKQVEYSTDNNLKAIWLKKVLLFKFLTVLGGRSCIKGKLLRTVFMRGKSSNRLPIQLTSLSEFVKSSIATDACPVL